MILTPWSGHEASFIALKSSAFDVCSAAQTEDPPLAPARKAETYLSESPARANGATSLSQRANHSVSVRTSPKPVSR